MTSSGEGNSLLNELKRRRVVRVAVGYAAAAFVVLQAAELVLEPLGVDARVMRWLVLAAIVGFPLALALGWLLDLTPEGIRVTPGRDAPGRLLVRLRPAWLVAGGTAGTVAAIAAMLATSGSVRAAPAGTEMIAVLPFSVSGEGVAGLQDAMVELLSRNLGEVGGVRTADPRLIMRHWRGREGDLSLEEAADLARRTYASSFLSGSVVGTGRSVRISADLYTLDGTRLASARVDGPAQTVLALVDSLSVALLRDVWRTTQPVPQMDVAAVTSGNLAALRHFLEGERHYRISGWNAAMRAYQEAVRADSTFALAHYKLSVAAGWQDEDAVATAAVEAALRHAPRLPAREQILVRAQSLRRSGRSALAVDTLSLYLEQYPDDAEAWFFLADDLYHLRDERADPLAPDPGDALFMFDRALELDSTFVPSLIHPLEVSFAAGDTARVAHYLRLLAAAPRVDTVAVAVYAAALRALASPGDAALAGDALEAAAAAPAGIAGSLHHQAQRATAAPLLARLALQSAQVQRAVVTRLLASSHDRASGWGVTLMMAGGRLDEARGELERLARERTLTRATLRQLAAAPVLAGAVGTEFLLPDATLAPEPPVRAAMDALAAYDRRDLAAFRAGMERLRGTTQDTLIRRLAPALQAGLERVLGGEVEGLVDAEAALQELGFVPQGLAEAFWFRVLAAQAGEPTLRERALRRLSRPWRGDPLYEPMRVAVLRRAGTSQRSGG